MNFVRLILELLQRRKRTLPLPKEIAVIFIDLPNVRDRDPWINGQPRPKQTNWGTLAKTAKKCADGLFIYEATVYERLHGDNRSSREAWARGARKKWTIFGFGFVTNETDVDPLIMAAMLGVVKRVERKGVKRIRIVIVSGDKDYVETCRIIEDKYGHKLILEFLVLSWETKLSYELSQYAGPGNVYLLDTVSGILDK